MPVQLPASQQTPPAQLGAPVQLTKHEAPEQLTRLHAFSPLQPTDVSPALLATPAVQVRAPEQSTAQPAPLHVIACVQESGFLHLMSQNGESHTIGPVQVVAAVHATLHLLPLHVMRCLHEPAPMQLMLHELAALQSIIAVHESAPVHVTVQGMPAGHAIGSVHVSAAVHVIMQFPAGSHVPIPASAQIDGHASTALTARASPASALTSDVGAS